MSFRNYRDFDPFGRSGGFGGGGGFDPFSDFRRATAVKSLIIANVAIYVIQLLLRFNNPLVEQKFIKLFGAVPELITTKFFLWQFVTAAFLHGDFWHIVMNMLGLFFFGAHLEMLWGKAKFLKFYFIVAILANVFAYLLNIHNPIPTIGASGAVMGVMGAFAAINPNATVILMVFPLKVKYLVGFYFVMNLLGVLGLEGGSGVAYAVHVAGLVLGVGYIKVVRGNAFSTLRYNFSERIRLWKLRRKYRNFRVVDSDVKKMWDDLEDKINREDGRNRHIN